MCCTLIHNPVEVTTVSVERPYSSNTTPEEWGRIKEALMKIIHDPQSSEENKKSAAQCLKAINNRQSNGEKLPIAEPLKAHHPLVAKHISTRPPKRLVQEPALAEM